MFESSSSGTREVGAGSAQSIRRIMREYEEIRNNKNPYWTVSPLNLEDPFEWHFTVRGPIGTEFDGGMYHGRIVLPQNYPLGPPSFILLNQNGRFEVGRKVCLSTSTYHPELWQPAWGLRTMLDALHAFFATPSDGSLHGLDWPADIRKKLAIESTNWECPICRKSNAVLVSDNCINIISARPELPAVLIQSVDGKQSDIKNHLSDVSSPKPAASSSASNEHSNIENTQQTDRSARITNREITRSITFTVLFRIFILSPIHKFFKPFIYGTTGKKVLHFLDIMALFLFFTTLILLIDAIRRPGTIATAFLLDRVI